MSPSINKIRLLAIVWTCVLVACAVAWSFQLTSFLDAKGLVLAVGLIVAVCMQCCLGVVSPNTFQRFILLWLGLSAWMISGFFTARVLSFHIEKTVYLALMLLAASLAADVFNRPGGRIWLQRGLLFSGAVVGALALLQYAGLINFLLPAFPGYDQRAYSVFGNQNLLGGYMALTLALLVTIPPQHRKTSRCSFLVCIIVFGILLGALLISATRSAWLAAAMGCGWGLVKSGLLRRPGRLFTRRLGKRAAILATVAAMILLLGAPIVSMRVAMTFSDGDVGGNSRLWFWAGAAHLIAANPAAGVGLGNYAYWSPYYQGRALKTIGADRLYHNELHTVHAHSEPLEWLAETGIVGVIFSVCFVVIALRRRRIETAGLIALGVFACFNTVSHSPPHLLAGLLLAANSMSAARPASAASPRKAQTAITIAVAIILAFAYAYTTLIPSALLSRAENIHIADGASEPLYLRALRWPWPNPQAHESYAIALMDAGRFDAARIQLEQSLEGLDTGRVHLLLAICAEAVGDKKAAFFYARECLERWPDNEHAKSLAAAHTQVL